jgi:hypothetical protein
VARLDALHTTIRGLQTDSHGRGHHMPRHFGNDSFAKIKFQIPLYNGKYDPAAYLDWELQVEQQLSYHDIYASSQVQIIIRHFTDLALMWWLDYNERHPNTFPTTLGSIKSCYATQICAF